MKPTLLSLLKGVACSGALAVLLGATPALAQVEIHIGPPAWFIATSRPVYHQGRAAYWYGNHWVYRERGEWHQYRDEPPELREHRRGPRQHYERGEGFRYR
jgi:hypothetical protein